MGLWHRSRTQLLETAGTVVPRLPRVAAASCLSSDPITCETESRMFTYEHAALHASISAGRERANEFTRKVTVSFFAEEAHHDVNAH